MRAVLAEPKHADIIERKKGMKLEDAVGEHLDLPGQALQLERVTATEYRVSMTAPFSGQRYDNIGKVVEIAENRYAFEKGPDYDII